jgi:uncharacterized phiE125 gp8 family phage protein
MRLTLLTGPAAEPLVLDDARAHLRIDGEDEDALLGSLITTSRMHVEAALGMALITQQWRWQADCWPKGGVVELMTRPLQGVTEVRVHDEAGLAQVVDAGDYIVDGVGQSAGHAARVVSKSARWPEPGLSVGGIHIDFTAGFGDTPGDVPEQIRQALRLLVAHWYEVRNPVHIGSMATRVPETVSELLMPFRVRRL